MRQRNRRAELQRGDSYRDTSGALWMETSNGVYRRDDGTYYKCFNDSAVELCAVWVNGSLLQTSLIEPGGSLVLIGTARQVRLEDRRTEGQRVRDHVLAARGETDRDF